MYKTDKNVQYNNFTNKIDHTYKANIILHDNDVTNTSHTLKGRNISSAFIIALPGLLFIQIYHHGISFLVHNAHF